MTNLLLQLSSKKRGLCLFNLISCPWEIFHAFLWTADFLQNKKKIQRLFNKAMKGWIGGHDIVDSVKRMTNLVLELLCLRKGLLKVPESTLAPPDQG